MPTYKITDPTSGQSVKLTGDSPPTEQELNDIFSKIGGQQSSQPQQSTPQQPQIKPSIFETNPLDIAKTFGYKPGSFEQKLTNVTEPWRQRGLSAGLGAVNTGLMGIPEIISQKLTGRRFVPNQAPIARAVGEVGGFAGGVPGKVLGGVGGMLGKVMPSMRTIPSAFKGIVTGGASGATMLPSPEEAPTMQKAKQIIGQRAGIGATLGGITGMIAPQVMKFQKWLKPKNQLALAEEARNSLSQQKNNLIEKYGDVYNRTIKQGQGTVSLQEPLLNLIDESDDIVNTIKGNAEVSEALAKGEPNAKRIMNILNAFVENPQQIQKLSLEEADGLQKYIRNLPSIRGKLASQYKGGWVDFTNADRVLLGFANDIKAQVMNLSPELNLVNKEYGSFMSNYKQVRRYLKWDNAIPTILDIHNPQKVAITDLMQRTLPPKVMNDILMMNRTIRNAELLKRIAPLFIAGTGGYALREVARRK